MTAPPRSSTKLAAGWVFSALPIEPETEDELMRGGVKGLLVSWYAVGLVLLLLIQLAVVGPGHALLMILGFEVSLLIALHFTRRWQLGMLFTRSIRKASGAQNIGLMFAMMACVGLAVGVQLALAMHPASLVAGILVSGFLLRRSWRALGRMRVAKPFRL